MNGDRPDCETESSGVVWSPEDSLFLLLLQPACGRSDFSAPVFPQRLKASLILHYLGRSLKPRPFKASVDSGLSMPRPFKAGANSELFRSLQRCFVRRQARHGRGWGFSPRTAKYCPFSPFADSASARVINNWRPFSRAANQTSERKHRYL